MTRGVPGSGLSMVNQTMRTAIVRKLRARRFVIRQNVSVKSLSKSVARAMGVPCPESVKDRSVMMRRFAFDEGEATTHAAPLEFKPLRLTREMEEALARTAAARHLVD